MEASHGQPRFACLLVEHLPVRVERLLEPGLAERPLVVLRPWDSAVLDASPEAMLAGVGVGDSRRRVEQLCPQATIIPARETLYQSHHHALKESLTAYADAIESAGLGQFFVEVGALARTFPSEKALALQIAAAAQRATRLPAAVGTAGNKFTAYRAAVQAAGESNRIVVVPAGAERRFVGPLPIAALPDPPLEMLRRLHLFGITTLRGLGQLPQAAVVLQFGKEAAFLHDLARGIDPRPLSPHAPPHMISRSLAFPDPISDRRLLLAALERLVTRLARSLNRAGYHAIALSLWVETGGRQEHVAGAPIKPPSADVQLLSRLAARLLGKLSLPGEATSMTLTAYPLREWHAGVRQLVLFQHPVTSRLEQLYQALRVLRQRFGEAIVRLASAVGPPLPLPIEVQTQADGTPARMHWSRWSREVKRVYEYWRERSQWWDQPVLRDYYQVESDGGLIFTLFRDEHDCWFLDRRRR